MQQQQPQPNKHTDTHTQQHYSHTHYTYQTYTFSYIAYRKKEKHNKSNYNNTTTSSRLVRNLWLLQHADLDADADAAHTHSHSHIYKHTHTQNRLHADVLYDGQNIGGAEPAGVRTLYTVAWHPARPQRLHRPAVRLSTRESRAIPAQLFSKTRTGK